MTAHVRHRIAKGLLLMVQSSAALCFRLSQGIFDPPQRHCKNEVFKIYSVSIEHFSRTGGLNRRKNDTGADRVTANAECRTWITPFQSKSIGL
jgi:hypothetical protein